VAEAKFTGSTAVTDPTLTVFFGKLKRKAQKIKKRTNHPIWNETFELYASPFALGAVETLAAISADFYDRLVRLAR